MWDVFIYEAEEILSHHLQSKAPVFTEQDSSRARRRLNAGTALAGG